MDYYLDIRNQIIITDDCDNDHLSNLELLIKYSKNKQNLKLLKKLLNNYKNNYNISELFSTTIRYTCSPESIDAIKLFIKHGADINFQDSVG